MSTTEIAAPPPRRVSAPDAEMLTEVVDGEIVEKPEMGAYSHTVVLKLYAAILRYLETTSVGIAHCEMMYILDSDRNLRRRPDVSFLSFQRWPQEKPIPLEGDFDVVPDLAVEVISPNDSFYNVSTKLEEYFRYGVREVWLVNPIQRLAHVYTDFQTMRVVRDHEPLKTEVLPEFSITPGSVFPPVASPIGEKTST